MPNKGDCVIVMSHEDNISIMAWPHDSKVALCISNIHPPACVMTWTDERPGGQDRAHVPSGLR
eukprot:2321211-Rhodomonas_salina.1